MKLQDTQKADHRNKNIAANGYLKNHACTSRMVIAESARWDCFWDCFLYGTVKFFCPTSQVIILPKIIGSVRYILFNDSDRKDLCVWIRRRFRHLRNIFRALETRWTTSTQLITLPFFCIVTRRDIFILAVSCQSVKCTAFDFWQMLHWILHVGCSHQCVN